MIKKFILKIMLITYAASIPNSQSPHKLTLPASLYCHSAGSYWWPLTSDLSTLLDIARWRSFQCRSLLPTRLLHFWLCKLLLSLAAPKLVWCRQSLTLASWKRKKRKRILLQYRLPIMVPIFHISTKHLQLCLGKKGKVSNKEAKKSVNFALTFKGNNNL